MPISIGLTYVNYTRALEQGGFDLSGTACPNADCRAASGCEPMVLTTTVVSRRLIVLERDAYGDWHTRQLEARIVLVRCRYCKSRRRLLPCDLLPYKHYSIPVIAWLVCCYQAGDLSLREVAWNLTDEHTPSYKTLHGWSEGLGTHVLGLPKGYVGGLPFSRVLVEAEARVPSVRDAWQGIYPVDARRYRSESRRERLSAVGQFIAFARTLSGESSPAAWVLCWCLMVQWTHSWVIWFPSRILCTAMTQVESSDLRSCECYSQRRSKPCRIRTRSPPGDSNKSRP